MSYRDPILATDLSEGSGTAARILPFLLDRNVHGTLAHVVAPPDLPPELATSAIVAMEQRIGESRADLERVLVEWARDRGLVDWTASVEYGLVGQTLARLAEERRADVIAVGSHGAGRIERALLGSTARSVLRHSTTDTLVARGDVARMDHVLLATDFQPPSRLAARRAHEIATQNLANVTILHAIDPGLFASALYTTPPEGRYDDEWLKKNVLGGLSNVNQAYFAGRARELAVHGRAASAVVEKARELQPDLIVVGSHGGGAVERTLLGSVAEGIAANAPCSVLVVR